MQGQPLWRQCVAETVGTFILALLGLGVVHAAALTGAHSGLWQVAIVWGLAVTLGIYATAAVSGAHLNPAMTIAFAVFGHFPFRKVGPYIFSQLIGAFLAAALLFAAYGGVIAHYEASHKLIRGQPGSERTAMVYGEYFPNPGGDLPAESVSEPTAMLAEAIGTAMLALVVFGVTDRFNSRRPNGTFFALFIGLAVSAIISFVAPLTQAGLNPARDFGPRLLAYLAGWGEIAIPGPRGGFFTVYILAPVLGGLAGGAAYTFLLHPAMEAAAGGQQLPAKGD